MGTVAPIQGIRPGFLSMGDSCQRVDNDVVSPSKHLSVVYNVPQKRTGLGGISTDDKKRVLAVPVSLLRTGGMYVEKRGYFHLS